MIRTHQAWSRSHYFGSVEDKKQSFVLRFGRAKWFMYLMCPWYTGRQRGPRLNADQSMLEYHADDPDLLASFGIWVYADRAVIRVRDHRARRWLVQWVAPFVS